MSFRQRPLPGPAGPTGSTGPAGSPSTAYTLTSAISSRSDSTRWSDRINVKEYGAIADGSSHHLSSVYGSLSAAQAAYPFATALTQEIDYCACKAASNAAFGADASEHGSNSYLNKRLYIPAGNYQFGDDTWTIRNLASAVIEGDGFLATELYGNKTVLAFDGVWYTEISNMAFLAQTNAAVAVLELDGNVPGHPYTTRGVQGVNLRNVLVDGGGSLYALTMTRQGGNGAQGSECLFLNVHLASATSACYYQTGFNALDNMFIGGDVQSFSKNGMQATAGSLHVIGTSFESTYGYTQILNDGYDVRVGDAGSYNFCMLHGCRTESPRFLHAAGAVFVDVRGISSNTAFGDWAANHTYSLNAAIVPATDSKRLFVVTTAGTSGGSEPDFASVARAGTISDNTVVWTETEFNFMSAVSGSVDRRAVQVNGPGNLDIPERYSSRTADTAVATTQIPDDVEFIAVDATSENKTVNLPLAMHNGRKMTVKKTDTSANTVTIKSLLYAIEIPATTTIVIPGGSRGSLTLQLAPPNGTSDSFWLVVNKT